MEGDHRGRGLGGGSGSKSGEPSVAPTAGGEQMAMGSREGAVLSCCLVCFARIRERESVGGELGDVVVGASHAKG
jgi:hypothetical protein